MWKVVQEMLILLVFILILSQMVLPPLLSLLFGREVPMWFLFKKKTPPATKLDQVVELSTQIDTKIHEADDEVKKADDELSKVKSKLEQIKSKGQSNNNQSNQSNS